jgi:integrase
MATITKRGRGWYVQVRRRGFRARSQTFRNKSEAQAWAREQETQLDAGSPKSVSDYRATTLGDLLRRYRDQVAPRARGGAVEVVRIGKMLRAEVSSISLESIGPAPFAAYRDDRLAEVKPATVSRELAIFRRVLNIARREWGFRDLFNPLSLIDQPQFHNARSRRLETGEADRLREALKRTRNPWLAPAITLAIETAMRKGELLGMEWRHVDLTKRTIFIPHAKNGRPRLVPLSDKAVELLFSLPRPSEKVLPTSSAALKAAWCALTRRAGLHDLHFHDLRHEAVSRYAEMGLTTPELAVISGHRDMRMLQRYTHLRPEDLAAKLIGRSWGGGRRATL